ncbi:hypothetical protein LFL96_22500 [Paraburkholderia sp. D15]|uniref:hypothetical protein n=1 Tax=Paraburkholderia sp. D15 TaxID=2880218 RepID=UPI00247915A6|nr:hypothetical protein [Paraburkholderia sp. D15]WGS53817.1 hypothetical protein LFL96_22500 [Paraburkholderia sp. D15]
MELRDIQELQGCEHAFAINIKRFQRAFQVAMKRQILSTMTLHRQLQAIPFCNHENSPVNLLNSLNLKHAMKSGIFTPQGIAEDVSYGGNSK